MMFRLHALRTGCLAGENYPIVDPDFRMRDDNGEFTEIFKKMWRVHATTLVGFSMLTNGLPDVDFKWDPSKISFSGGSLTPDSPSTLSPRAGPRKQRSMINMALAYWSSISSLSTSGSPSTPGTMSSSPRVDISTASDIPTLTIKRESSPTVRIALQEFVQSCKLSELEIQGVGHITRFPLLKAMLMRRDTTLSHLQV